MQQTDLQCNKESKYIFETLELKADIYNTYVQKKNFQFESTSGTKCCERVHLRIIFFESEIYQTEIALKLNRRNSTTQITMFKYTHWDRFAKTMIELGKNISLIK